MPNGNGKAKRPFVLTQFSDPIVTVTLTTSGALDPSVGSVVVPAGYFPTGTALQRVEAIVMFRKITNSNAALNRLAGATQYIQVQKAAGGFANCIKFVDDQFNVAASSDGPGDAIVGGIDVKATVNVDNATYNFQWENALTEQDSIVLHDVRVGLRFYLW